MYAEAEESLCHVREVEIRHQGTDLNDQDDRRNDNNRRVEGPRSLYERKHLPVVMTVIKPLIV